jgi:hypothetical protein
MASDGDLRAPTSDKTSLYLEEVSTHHAFRAFRADLGILCAFYRPRDCLRIFLQK